MINIVPTLPEHAYYVAEHIRPADAAEMAAGYSLTPLRAIQIGMKVSALSWTGMVEGKVIAIMGVHQPTLLSETARPWMLGTADLDRDDIKFEFLGLSRRVVRAMIKTYSHLENYVDARNAKAIAWLKWLGFTIHDPEPHGPLGMPFHRFEMRRS